MISTFKSTTGRRADPGERCSCGRQATWVLHTDQGDLPYCGVPSWGTDDPKPFVSPSV